ncbi:TPA: hypothetical protein ACPJ0R_004629 [Vibrio diabolicus]
MCYINGKSGFEDLVDKNEFDEKVKLALPTAIDRYNESRYFAQLLSALEPNESNIPQANWLLSAFFSAVISIREAAEIDITSRGISKSDFNKMDIAKEFYLPSDSPDPYENDPLAVNRMFRDIRNLRVHFAVPLVEIKDGKWNLLKIEQNTFLKLKRRQTTEQETTAFFEYKESSSFIKGLFQHLFVLSLVISQTIKEINA